MSEAKKGDKKKRKIESQTTRVEDLELRNYLIKKLKVNDSTSQSKIQVTKTNPEPILEQPTKIIEESSIIKVTNNGKQKIRLYVSDCEKGLNDNKTATLVGKDKAMSRLVSVVEIIKSIFKKQGVKLQQQNQIYNEVDQQTMQKTACMKITLIKQVENITTEV